MRSIWKGAISFGLVTIPVALFSATEDKKPKFKMLRAEDGSAIKYKRVAEADGKEVAWDEIVKGFEVDKSQYVVFTDEELEAVRVAAAPRLIDVVQFVDATEIDPIQYRTSYYLAPEEAGAKAYRILQQALSQKGRVGIARFALRAKEHLAALRSDGDVLVLETMFWPDEIRTPEFDELSTNVDVRPEELQMAEMIIDNLTGSFDPTAFHDRTREAIEELAQQKLEGREIVSASVPEPTKVLDLLEALKASVEATKRAS
jgi:DNA end-binding protein Ku